MIFQQPWDRCRVGDLLFKCGRCNFETSSKGRLKSHEKVHQRRYFCDDCDYVTSLRWQIQRHQKEAHKDVYHCDKCGYETVRKSLFRWHQEECKGGSPKPVEGEGSDVDSPDPVDDPEETVEEIAERELKEKYSGLWTTYPCDGEGSPEDSTLQEL